MSFLRHYFRQHPPSRVAWRAGGLLLIRAINGWMSTLNFRMARYDDRVDPACSEFVGPAIYLVWHEYIPTPLYLRPYCQMALLVSRHQDAEILSHAAHFAGLETVRGSSGRGAIGAVRTLLERGRGSSIAITPDGPRGPRRVLAPGCIYLASRLQIPLVPLGCGYDRPWRYRRVWDQFAIPRPFSRGRAICGPSISIPADLEKDDIEKYRIWIESVLNQLTVTAEQWAEGRIQLKPELALYPSPARALPHG